ncbi:MAG: hypothetical protein WCK93_02080 [Nitrosomonadales bacterium]
MTLRIGIDFDNTLACYDQVFSGLARELDLINLSEVKTKQEIRALARLRDERLWQRIQGIVYGQRMQQAALFSGAADFLAHCAASGVEVCIVSHKTRFGHHDETQTNLRDAARLWMRNQGFFDRYAILEENLYFESTQSDKIARINGLQCDFFIDDLPEILHHPELSHPIKKILFNSNAAAGNVITCGSWTEIEAVIFGR